MLLGFKQRFCPMVEDGSKRHTIRGPRARRPRVGEICHNYYALRTKACRLLGRWPCVKLQTIRIDAVLKGETVPVVWIDGEPIDMDEMNALAWADGFRSRGRAGAWSEMFEYWTSPTGRSTDPPALPFIGWIIHWDYDKPVAAGQPKSPVGGRLQRGGM